MPKKPKPFPKTAHIVLAKWVGATPNMRVPDGWLTLDTTGGWSAGVHLDAVDSVFATKRDADLAIDQFLDDQTPMSPAEAPLMAKLQAYGNEHEIKSSKKALEGLLKADPEARKLHKQLERDGSDKAMTAWLRNWQFLFATPRIVV